MERVTGYLDTSAAGIEQPAALVPFFEHLYQTGRMSPDGPVHILHFGDSHTAADEWTGDVRRFLKEHFGDGGPGFVLAGHPFPGYHRSDVRGGSTSGWRAEGFHSTQGDGYYGLGGISLSTERADQSVFIETECDTLEIHYLQQNNGGTVALYDGERLIDKFSTDGELGPAFKHYEASPGPHRFTLKTLTARPVRLFGWAADRKAGLTYEALGINGVEASVILHWNEAMLATYLQRRHPALIVLAYGTNEAVERRSSQAYQTMFSTILERFRRACPGTPILVIGPPDGYVRMRGRWQPLPEADGIIAAQQAACRQRSCAFWDMRGRMGGEGSMRDWAFAGLAQGDYIHFTSAGYHRLAEVLFSDLARQYDAFKKIRSLLMDAN
jgi:lysophospholipase L1-like esterase